MFESDKHKLKILEKIFDLAYEGLIVTDSEGTILMINKPYLNFLGYKKEEVIGRKVTHVIENTRMHIVASTGQAEIGHIQQIKGHRIIASRIPIKEDHRVIGVVGKVLFKDVKDLYTLTREINKMGDQLEYYKGKLKKAKGAKYSFDSLIGKTEKLKDAINMARMASHTDSNVLLTGESGTGKELFAHAIHDAGNRSLSPFVKINCAAVPTQLLESELFGYEGGAFTGAKKGGKPGKLEIADGGTVFLDEIGDMPLVMQAKLLRVIQEREIEPVGSIKTKEVDVRIIAATNKELVKEVEKGNFRSDLFYRLNVVVINIPSLRERMEDIELLVTHFINKLSYSMGKYVQDITEDALEKLKNYHWPGNVRELENVIERAINLVKEDGLIKSVHLPQRIFNSNSKKYFSGGSLYYILEDIERDTIISCLEQNKGNKKRTAEDLNISRSSLYDKLKKYGL